MTLSNFANSSPLPFLSLNIRMASKKASNHLRFCHLKLHRSYFMIHVLNTLWISGGRIRRIIIIIIGHSLGVKLWEVKIFFQLQPNVGVSHYTINMTKHISTWKAAKIL